MQISDRLRRVVRRMLRLGFAPGQIRNTVTQEVQISQKIRRNKLKRRSHRR